jgi:hypothetical protein
VFSSQQGSKQRVQTIWQQVERLCHWLKKNQRMNVFQFVKETHVDTCNNTNNNITKSESE